MEALAQAWAFSYSTTISAGYAATLTDLQAGRTPAQPWKETRARRCLSTGHSSRVSCDIVRILECGVMGDVDGAGCDHGGGAGGPA